MDLWLFLKEMVMLLAGAFILGALARRLRQSPLIGYLLAGTVVGPLLFDTTAVNQAAELGVSLLLFSIGLEFSFQQLRRMGRMAFGGGSLQVIVTLALVAAVLFRFTGTATALTLGAIVALSSTTIVLRLLVDRTEIDSVRGRTCLGILLLQDIAIVPLVLMVSLLLPAAGDSSVWLHIGKIALAALGLTAVFYLLLYRVIPLLLSKVLFVHRELTVLLAISVGLGAAWSAHSVNISPALGAFVAGMLLGESPFATQIRADIGTLRIIMVTLFFASVGMLAKPLWFVYHLHVILAVALAILVLKALVIFGITRMFGLNSRQAVATGITLAQVGEFAFVLAILARDGGVLTENLTDLIISVSILLMLATPFLVGLAAPLADRMVAFFSKKKPANGTRVPTAQEGAGNRILLVGLGPAGRQVVQSLLAHNVAPVAIDLNPGSQAYGRQAGIEVHLGDADNEEILVHAGIANACMAVVTIPDPRTAMRVVQLMRRLHPSLLIVVRGRYNRYITDLVKAGADNVVDEETTIGRMLGRAVTESVGKSVDAELACRLGGIARKTPADSTA